MVTRHPIPPGQGITFLSAHAVRHMSWGCCLLVFVLYKLCSSTDDEPADSGSVSAAATSPPPRTNYRAPKRIDIFVRIPGEDNLLFSNLKPDDTISVLEDRISARRPGLTGRRGLAYRGKKLQVYHTFDHYHIEDNSTIDMIIRAEDIPRASANRLPPAPKAAIPKKRSFWRKPTRPDPNIF